MRGLFFICALLLSMQLQAKNSFLVAPGLVEFDLTKPTTQSFIITNDGDEPIRLTINPIYFDIGDPSLNMGKHINDETRDIEDITKSVRISPKRLSLNPGQRRDIRVSIRPDKSLTDGDYRTHILVQMLETAQVIQTAATDDSNGVGMEIAVKMETAVAIYGKKGESIPEVEFQCTANPDSGSLMLRTVNNTDWRFDGQVQLVNSNQGNTPIFDGRVVSLRGSIRDINVDQAFDQSGTYRLTYRLANTPDVERSGTCAII